MDPCKWIPNQLLASSFPFSLLFTQNGALVIIKTRGQQEAGAGCQPLDRSSALKQTFCRGEFVKTPAGLDTLQSYSRRASRTR